MSGYAVSHRKVRLDVPRLSDHKDHADGANAPPRARNHGADGRFAKGNRAAAGTGAKRAVRHLVPARGRRLFDDLVRQVGASGGTLALLHVADAVVHQLDALELSELARAAGLSTPEGAALHVRAQRSSELAIRSATAALETARLFRTRRPAKPKAGTPPGFETEEEVPT